MASQWERLLKNQGTWKGSFTQFSATGEQLSDVPTVVSLKPLNRGDTMRQEIRKYPSNSSPEETVLEYRSLNRSTLFFEDGAFSQGSMQWGPWADFGAELGFIYQFERLRLVEFYQRQRTLSAITLIREHLEDAQPTPRPAVTLEQLVGIWEGEAFTEYPDFRPADSYATRLEITQNGNQVHQTLKIGDSATIQSSGEVQGNRVVFQQGSQPVTVLFLPSGASAAFPSDIVSGQPLFLEAGWLIQPDLRQRMIRMYDAQGTWFNLTLVTERKIA